MADEEKKPPELDEEAELEEAEEESPPLQTQLTRLTEQLNIAQAIAVKEKKRTDELNNFVARLQADFDNFRKRNAEQSKRQKEDGIVAVIEKLVPVLDVVKQAIDMIPDEKVVEGVRMIDRQLIELLESFGVSEIEALGFPFDPNVHNAVMQVEARDEDEANTVVEVFGKGYKLGDRLIRPSVVKVAK